MQSDTSVHVIVSAEPYLRRQAVARFVDAARSVRALTMVSYDLAEIGVAEVLTAAQGVPLFAPRELFVCHNLDMVPTKAHAPLLAFLTQPGLGTTLLFTASKLDARHKLTQALKARDLVETIAPLPPHAREAWLADAARARQLNATRGALAKLLTLVGSDMDALDQSLEKLSLFHASATDGAALTEHDVERVVTRTREGNIFQLVDALGQRDTRAAAAALTTLLDSGEQPLVILSMIERQLRLLIAAKEPGATLPVPAFVARALAAQARPLLKERLLACWDTLTACDVQLKTQRTDAPLILLRAIYEVALARDSAEPHEGHCQSSRKRS